MPTRSFLPLPLLLLGAGFVAACGTTPAASDGGLDAAASEAGSEASAEATVDPDASSPEAAVDATPDVPLMPVMVSTAAGAVVGSGAPSGSAEFLGIPFAAPPTGANRWRAPQPVTPWTTPRDARAYGPSCMQTVSSGSTTRVSEDCLQLNVWTPRVTGGGATGRPVMVFVHGGGYTSGSGTDALYNGASLANATNTVVVTVNYRLGQFGFLATPELLAEDTQHHSAGNYGLMDQQAALQWVRDNIASFGGNPGNVTLFGESAGAFSVCLQTVSPPAMGLFHRVIMESGSCVLTVTRTQNPAGMTSNYEDAVSLGNRFASTLGCTGAGTLSCLRATTAERVLATTPTPLELTLQHARFQPSIDGYVLPDRPWTLQQRGMFARVPQMMGSNRDEGTVFSVMFAVNTRDEFRAALGTLFLGFTPAQLDARFAEVSALYADTIQGSWADAWTAFLGDMLFVCPARETARVVSATNTPTYLYHFTRVNRAGMLLNLGVFHSAELPYVFDNFPSPFIRTAGDAPVVNLTRAAWARFAETGNPGMVGTTTWPAYQTSTDQHELLDTTPAVQSNLRQPQCDAVARWLMDLR